MIDGSAWAVMTGLGEQFLPVFILALALGDVASGWIVTLPPLLGAVLQLTSGRAVRWLGSHRRWVVLTAGLQALCWVPMVIVAAVGASPVWAVFAMATAYYASGAATGAAWSTWIGTLVPRRVRAKWFGKRQRATQLGLLIGFLIGGVALGAATGFKAIDQASDNRKVLWVLAGLFAAAAVCRAISTWHLHASDEPVPLPDNHRHVSVKELWTRTVTGAGSGDARLLIYVASVWLASNISSPFVNAYVLTHLATPYMPWAMLIGVVMLGKVLTLAALGRFAHKHGSRKLMLIGGVLIVPIGAMWMVSTEYWWLVMSQLFSGLAWGCFELGIWLLILERMNDDERTSLMSYYFLFIQIGMALGSLIGGWLLSGLGHDHRAYLVVFACSSVARLMTIPLLLVLLMERKRPKGGEQRADETIAADTVAWEEGRP